MKESFDNLIDCLTPPLSKKLVGGGRGAVRSFMALYTLANLRRRVFNFNEYRFQTWCFDGEELLPLEETKNMLNALREAEIIYGKNRSKMFIRRRLYRTLSRLYLEKCDQDADELEANFLKDGFTGLPSSGEAPAEKR